MGKHKEATLDEEEKDGNTLEVPVVLTHTAISVCNITGEGWSLVKIKFNPLTGDVGTITKKYTGEIRPYIEEKFRIETIEEDIFNNCQSPWRK